MTLPFVHCRLLLFATALFIASCQSDAPNNQPSTPVPDEVAEVAPPQAPQPETPLPQAAPVVNLAASATTILLQPQVPILCYHQIRDWRTSDSKQAKDYIVPTERFEEQLKMLADSGYHAILPDQLLAYLTTGAPLPAKPVMLTFDDTNLDQYTVAAPLLDKYGFKGVFFVMTVSMGRPRYMSRAQVKELADNGHVIGCHTWDHQNVKKLKPEDWYTQVEKPKQVLEEITGKPVNYFAYPFGLWNKEVIPELQQRGFTAAFQLATSQDADAPLFTIRRIIASGYWKASTLHGKMTGSFQRKDAPMAL
ncbi:polysaccharide deacetylase family protein [Pontibacter sp. E15-1]|uniref:polysaccharide deacetylase family protein n=1 Tax=Pontibacter sp. E15-1 TaxID=2919918 RepID=UPI001F4F1592|nr:polysaccharide deacetylase family protein [Pontibacter sp. E15-1]MCJ8166382.1 polysaccharide deacetylase family protein [Pontibacter sp. E15-1]